MTVTKAFLRFSLLALLTLLTACGGVTLPDGTGGAAPLIQLAGAPQDPVRSFLDAWNARDYQAMYALLSSNSQGLTSYSVFETTYENADTAIGTQNLSYTLGETVEQGISATVRYDLTITSSVFGTITDPGRLMRVVKAPNNQWRIAWTQMDIFEGYAPGTRLTSAAVSQPRGNIYDRNGIAFVEQDTEVIGLYVALSEMFDEVACVDLLASVLRKNRADLQAEVDVRRANPETVFYVGDIDPADFANAQESLLSACNIRTDSRTTRRYAGHGIASHVIGYVGQISAAQLEVNPERGYNADSLVGLTGIEALHEEALAGSAERVLQIVEPGGLTIRALAGTTSVAPQPVTLTLDYNLQRAAAQALSDAYNEAAGNWAGDAHSPGAGIVMLDVNTGAVLAMASYPTFDPGIFNPDTPTLLVGQEIGELQSDARRPFANRVYQDQYPPGSTFKIITLAAASEEHTWRPSDMFYCGMEWQGAEYGDSRPVRYDWRNWEPEERRFDTGEITMSQALTASCNPFFYQMGALLTRTPDGFSTLGNYSRRMGLGRPTGLVYDPSVPEAAGQLAVINSTDVAISAAIGQSDTQVTILQMARMVAGIANGGTLYTPYIVQQVGAGDNVSFQGQPQAAGEMNLGEETLALIREGMCAVTTQATVGTTTGQPIGTAWFVFDDDTGTGIAPYSVCAKTGTAQTGRVEPNGWFVAYAPADNPQVAVAAMVEYGREGSETAAPIVRRLLDAYFNAYTAPYPWWWSETPYEPLQIPEGNTGG